MRFVRQKPVNDGPPTTRAAVRSRMLPPGACIPRPAVNPEIIRQLIETGLPGASADVRGDDGVHFEATVVADAFRGKLPLARHRLVYATLGDRMGGEIHALALKTLTPEEAAA